MNRFLSFYLILFYTLLSAAGSAQVAPPSPPEVSALKAQYRSDLQAAQGPVRTRYQIALEALLQTHSKSGNLDAALAVQQELDLARGRKGLGAPGQPSAELAALKSRFETDIHNLAASMRTRYVASLETL